LSYDLTGATAKDRYDVIATALRRAGAERVLFSQWTLRGASAMSTFNSVKGLFDADDRVLVSPLGNDIAQYNLLTRL